MKLEDFEKLANELMLAAYDRVELHTRADFGFPIVGQYRARVTDVGQYAFDRRGRAVWVTGAVFDYVVPIADILTLKLAD